MPIYEYSCRECNCEFESLLLNTEEKESVRCPRCGGDRIERLPSCFASTSGESGTLKSGCGSPKTGGFS